MSISFTDQKPVFIDSLGNPASFAKIDFYEVGTTTPKIIYTDAALIVEAENPQILGADGRTENQIFMGYGVYTCDVSRFIGDNILEAEPGDWAPDNQFDLQGLSLAPTSESTPSVPTIAGLKALDPAVYGAAIVTGHYAAGDCGARTFYWSALNADSENMGTIVASSVSATGRWLYMPATIVDVREFGAIPGGQNCNGAIAQCESWCNALTGHPVTMYIPRGVYTVSGALSQPIRVPIKIDNGVTFINDSAATDYKINISSYYDIQISTALQSIHSIGGCWFKFSGISFSPIKSIWFGSNEVCFNRFILDVSDNYTFEINENIDTTLVTSGGEKKCRLSFTPIGFLVISGSGFTLKPYSIKNENLDGCIYFADPMILNLSYMKEVFASWFSSSYDFSSVLRADIMFNPGTALIIDKDVTASTAVVLASDWIVVAGGGVITASADIYLGSVQAGDVALFSGSANVKMKGKTNVLWWALSETMTASNALYRAISCAKNSLCKTLDGRDFAMSVAGVYAVQGITIENLSLSGTPSFIIVDSANFVNCKLISTTDLMSVISGATVDLTSCLLSSTTKSITSTTLSTTGYIRASKTIFRGDIWIASAVNFVGCTIGDSAYGTEKINRFAYLTDISACTINTSVYSINDGPVMYPMTFTSNVFRGLSTANPVWRLWTSSASTIVYGVIFKDNVFTGSYTASLFGMDYILSGSGTFANDPKILICDNRSTNASLSIKTTRGTIDTAYTFSVIGSTTIGLVSLIDSRVFIFIDKIITSSDILTSGLFGLLGALSGQGNSATPGSMTLTTVARDGSAGASPQTVQITFELYR